MKRVIITLQSYRLLRDIWRHNEVFIGELKGVSIEELEGVSTRAGGEVSIVATGEMERVESSLHGRGKWV